MGYFTHTESHWQSEKSFLEYLEKVILPWKEANIHRLGLPVEQFCMLKVDLHFSHKTLAALELMRIFHILPLFVPVGCTDIMQECDTVINKPFKGAMKLAIRDHLHQHFNNFCVNTPTKRANEWRPAFKMSDLKPKMVSFVEAGLRALQTPEMIQTIIKSFETDGRFLIMRSNEKQTNASAEILEEVDINDIIVEPPLGEELSVEDEEPAIPQEFSEDENSDDDD